MVYRALWRRQVDHRRPGERKLYAAGCHTYTLDGGNLRHGLNRDLGFTETDRVENIRHAVEIAALMADAGLIVIASFISPYRAERQVAREMPPLGEFLEVFADTPIEERQRRGKHICGQREEHRMNWQRR
jgi:bifunctional enzyme CysN/CysC